MDCGNIILHVSTRMKVPGLGCLIEKMIVNIVHSGMISLQYEFSGGVLDELIEKMI